MSDYTHFVVLFFYTKDLPVEKEMLDACVAQWLEQSTGNRKTRARIPAQSKASFFPQKLFSNSLNIISYDFKFGNHKSQVRIPAQLKVSLLPQKDFKLFKLSIIFVKWPVEKYKLICA